MEDRHSIAKDMDHGFNSRVERNGRTYHVQSEYRDGDAPAVESLVFRGGEVLVHWITSYQDVAVRFGLTGDDIRHVLQQQHFDLVRKVRHGMLDGDEPPASPSAPEGTGVTDDPSEIEDPQVQELIAALSSNIDDVANKTRRQGAHVAPAPIEVRRRRPLWRRFVLCVRFRIGR